jgi:hypothetical protein
VGAGDLDRGLAHARPDIEHARRGPPEYLPEVQRRGLEFDAETPPLQLERFPLSGGQAAPAADIAPQLASRPLPLRVSGRPAQLKNVPSMGEDALA